jgi:hypothetical protein
MTSTRRLTFLLLALCLLVTSPVRACDTPVYRYALESWPADNYRAAFIQHGGLGPVTEIQVEVLKRRAASANLTVQVIDLDDPDGETLAAQFGKPDVSGGPVLVVRYPAATRIEGDAWRGPLTDEAIDALLESRARREAADRLRAGETVWLLLESGATEADEAAAKVVEEGRPASPPSVVVRVRRDDPAEAVLVRQLLDSEPDLAGRNEPMAFPVFGRGRVLYALVGAGITAENVRKAAGFLGGDCSCTIKRDNPGTDLLLSADWGELKVVEGRGDLEALVIREGTGDPAAPEPKRGSGAALWVATVFAGGLVLLTGAIALRSRQRGGSGPATTSG